MRTERGNVTAPLRRANGVVRGQSQCARLQTLCSLRPNMDNEAEHKLIGTRSPKWNLNLFDIIFNEDTLAFPSLSLLGLFIF